MSRLQYVQWHRKKGFVFGVLIALSSLCLGAAQSPTPPATAPPIIRLEKDLLSVQVTKHTLAEVLTALEKVMPLRVYYRGSQINALRDTKISMSYQNVPLLEGIRQLLDGQNYMINYDPKADASSKVFNIYFLSGTGDFSQLEALPEAPVSDTTETDTTEEPSVAALIQTTLTALEDEKRWNSLEALINTENYAQNPEIVKTLWTAVREDLDPDVRRSALDGLEEVSNADAPFDALAAVFRDDEDEGVRAWALNVLVQKYGLASKDLVKQAQAESSIVVNAVAKNLQGQLDELESGKSKVSVPTTVQE